MLARRSGVVQRGPTSDGCKSKRPLVKTYPNWSKRPKKRPQGDFWRNIGFKQRKVSKGAKIRNRYILTQDTNGKVTNSQLDTTNESQEVSPSQQVTTKHI